MEGPRILTIDIETAPALVWTFDLFKPFIGIDQIEQPTRVICFAAKWRHEKKVMFFAEWTDEDFIEKAFELLDQADVVVTYNGDNFDIPHLNREFDLRNLGTPSPFHSADLYKVGRKNHRYLSHKLAHITEQLGLSGKMQHEGFPLWLKVLKGDPKAQGVMTRYNKQDVVTTEELFEDWLPYITSLPAYSLYVDDEDPHCPRCGSEHIQRRGYATTKVRKYPRYHCQACGTWSRGARSVKGVDLR